jgi:hypothetical protein
MQHVKNVALERWRKEPTEIFLPWLFYHSKSLLRLSLYEHEIKRQSSIIKFAYAAI